jgi:hypothetical protein
MVTTARRLEHAVSVTDNAVDAPASKAGARVPLQPRGRPAFQHRGQGEARARPACRPRGFQYDGGGIAKGGTVTISVDEKPVAEGWVERTIPFRMALDDRLDIGEDTGAPVSEDYQVPFKFTGTLNPSSCPSEKTSSAPLTRRRFAARWLNWRRRADHEVADRRVLPPGL